MNFTSKSPMAMDKATPVDLNGLFPWATGQGSLCNSPSKSVKLMSHLCSGCKNLKEQKIRKSKMEIMICFTCWLEAKVAFVVVG